MKHPIDVADLIGVIYSSGKVFNGLSTSRLDTENFLRSGDTQKITSRSDLGLLQDLRDVAKFTIAHIENNGAIDADFTKQLNACISRSGAIRAGELRTSSEIGVSTAHGRHNPKPITDDELAAIISEAIVDDPREAAMNLFIGIARAQPFDDGNKRTALFLANAWLLKKDTGTLLTVPFDDNDPSLASGFNSQLGYAYITGDDTGAKDLMRQYGFTEIPDPIQQSPVSFDPLPELSLMEQPGGEFGISL